jgi:hypothetical protein
MSKKVADKSVVGLEGVAQCRAFEAQAQGGSVAFRRVASRRVGHSLWSGSSPSTTTTIQFVSFYFGRLAPYVDAQYSSAYDVVDNQFK